MRYVLCILIFVVVAVVALFGFRGEKFTEPPIYVFPDMDRQAKYLPQGKNDFFSDERNSRPVPANTVQRGYEWDAKKIFSEDYKYDVAQNPRVHTAKEANGEWVKGFPLEVSHELMAKGREKYDIFCIVCHGKNGDGNGITKQYGMVATPSFHTDRIRTMAEGQLFDVIDNGKGLMGSYGAKLDAEERWAVIAYLRALQYANNASVDDVPANVKKDLGL